MRGANIIECIKIIRIKNCEGYDRIPQRILYDLAEILEAPFIGLFKRIYDQKNIPEKWSIAKVTSIHK